MACKSDKCTFMTADDARCHARDSLLLFDEITAIQGQILRAVSDKKYDTIVADESPMTTVAGILSATVVSGGAGYNSISPIVNFEHPIGSGATATAITNAGIITSILITAPGTGYSPISVTADMSMSGDSNALLQVVQVDGKITRVNVLSGGTGYAVNDIVTFAHPYGIGASAIVSSVNVAGTIMSVDILSSGELYNTISTKISISHPNGAGFAGTVNVSTGQVNSVSITSGGAGYFTVLPTAVITDSSGSGALIELGLDSGSISSATVINTGTGYTSPTVSVADVTGSFGSGANISVISASSGSVNSKRYYQVFANQVTDRVIMEQMTFVLSYFTNLGYNIKIEVNPVSGNTIQWHIFW